MLSESVEVDEGVIIGVSVASGCGMEQLVKTVNSIKVAVTVLKYLYIFLILSAHKSSFAGRQHHTTVFISI